MTRSSIDEALLILKTPHPVNENGINIVTIEYPKLYEIFMGLIEEIERLRSTAGEIGETKAHYSPEHLEKIVKSFSEIKQEIKHG